MVGWCESSVGVGCEVPCGTCGVYLVCLCGRCAVNLGCLSACRIGVLGL